MAMVAITGVMRRPRTSSPLVAPTMAPTARQPTTPRMSPSVESVVSQNDAMTTVRLIIEPTEMSMPPISTTLSCASATNASGIVEISRLSMFESVRKASDLPAV